MKKSDEFMPNSNTYLTHAYYVFQKEMKNSYIRDIITYVCGGSGIFGMLVASSLFLVTVGVRRVSFTRTTSKGSIP